LPEIPGQFLPAEITPDNLQPAVGDHDAFNEQLREPELF